MTHARIPDFTQPVLSRPVSAAFQRDLAAKSLSCIQKSASRFHSSVNLIGEFLTAVLIIAGGVLAYGFLPPL